MLLIRLAGRARPYQATLIYDRHTPHRLFTMSAQVSVKEVSWPLVEVGRVVFIDEGSEKGKLATIVEIITHRRVLVDGPSVERGGLELRNAHLTNIVIADLERGASSEEVAAAWKSADVDAQWEATPEAQQIKLEARRRELNDFERFQAELLLKQRREAVLKAVAKAN